MRSLIGPLALVKRRGGACSLCWLIALSVGCRGSEVRECTELVEAEDYEVAVTRCEELFDETGDPRAGAAAARAHFALGQADEVLAWVDRLRETSEEATLWRLAAQVHWQRRDTELAREVSLRELTLHRETGQPAEAAKVCYRLFYFSWAAGDYRAALRFAGQEFEEASKADDRELEAEALQALCIVLYEVGDLERAQETIEAAAALLGPEKRFDRARLLVYRGLIRLNTDRAALARDAFERALELAAGSEDRRFLRSTHLDLVKANLALEEVDLAEGHLQAARDLADPEGRNQAALSYYRSRVLHARGSYAEAAGILSTALGQAPDPAWTRDLEYQLGLVAEARGDTRSAEEAYLRAAEVVERMRGSLGLDELKSWLLDHKRRPFEALFRLQVRSGRAREALGTIERAKARTFLDVLISATAAAEVAGNGREVAVAAGERLDALEALLPTMTDSPVAGLRPIGETLDAVAGRHVLVYFQAGDELWLITVEGRRIRPRLLAASPATVRNLVYRFLARPDDLETAAELGEILLPAGSLAEPGSTLHVVADGILGRLPFAPLRRDSRHLVEDYVIAYVPSVNALAAIEVRPRPADGPSVVLADPRRDLPGAALEAEEVAARLGAVPRTGETATTEGLLAASRAKILHLATHTGLGPRGPWLALAEGKVTSGAVITGKVGPRLVVLAGCASALRRGKGMWGSLGAAFLAAGSETVLASLWSVEDQPTRDLVLRFYDEGGQLDPAGALARTQRAFIAAGEPPSVWAAFVLFGSGRPLRAH